jgi:hypothetical protein
MEVKTRLELKIGFKLFGGATSDTVFPHAEDLLCRTEYQKALIYVGKRKYMNRYKSTMDFLFGEIFTDWRWYIFQFYQDPTKYPRLYVNDSISEKQLYYWDAALCLALEVALQIMDTNRKMTWKKFQNITVDLLEAA